MRGVSREKGIVNFLYKRRIHIHTGGSLFLERSWKARRRKNERNQFTQFKIKVEGEVFHWKISSIKLPKSRKKGLEWTKKRNRERKRQFKARRNLQNLTPEHRQPPPFVLLFASRGKSLHPHSIYAYFISWKCLNNCSFVDRSCVDYLLQWSCTGDIFFHWFLSIYCT